MTPVATDLAAREITTAGSSNKYGMSSLGQDLIDNLT